MYKIPLKNYQNSKTVIKSGSDTNIISSQVKGKRIELTAENLNIESLQDTAKSVKTSTKLFPTKT